MIAVKGSLDNSMNSMEWIRGFHLVSQHRIIIERFKLARPEEREGSYDWHTSNVIPFNRYLLVPQRTANTLLPWLPLRTIQPSIHIRPNRLTHSISVLCPSLDLQRLVLSGMTPDRHGQTLQGNLYCAEKTSGRSHPASDPMPDPVSRPKR